MASAGSNSGSKMYDFGSDDILCSYEDHGNQDSVNGTTTTTTHSDPAIGTHSPTYFHNSKMGRSSGGHPASAFSPPVESLNEDVIATVEKVMKKYTDNLMRFLEGISSRLSQLELYCYNLDKSIGEMRTDLARDHEEADSKLKSVEKHIQEVHRSMQILRDKQELAETQKELAKLQFSQKESNCASEEKATPPQASDPKKSDNSQDAHNNQQLALAPPLPQPSLPQSQAPYYAQVNTPQGQYPPPSDSQYQALPQMQDSSRVPPTQANQSPQIHPAPQYQQWPPPQVQQLPHQSLMQPQPQPQVRAPSPGVYPHYPANQPANPSAPEPLPSSMQMQMPMPMPMQMPFGYGGGGGPVQPHSPSQQIKPSYGMQPGDGYAATGPHHPIPSQGNNAYMMYESDGGRAHHPSQPQQPHFPHGSYPPTSVPVNIPQQHASSGGAMARPLQLGRHRDLIEKMVAMGYRGDQVVAVIQRMEESGEAVDFNAVLDRLNAHSSSGGGAPRRF